jgi:hypothetical protein
MRRISVAASLAEICCSSSRSFHRKSPNTKNYFARIGGGNSWKVTDAHNEATVRNTIRENMTELFRRQLQASVSDTASTCPTLRATHHERVVAERFFRHYREKEEEACNELLSFSVEKVTKPRKYKPRQTPLASTCVEL